MVGILATHLMERIVFSKTWHLPCVSFGSVTMSMTKHLGGYVFKCISGPTNGQIKSMQTSVNIICWVLHCPHSSVMYRTLKLSYSISAISYNFKFYYVPCQDQWNTSFISCCAAALPLTTKKSLVITKKFIVMCLFVDRWFYF